MTWHKTSEIKPEPMKMVIGSCPVDGAVVVLMHEEDDWWTGGYQEPTLAPEYWMEIPKLEKDKQP